MARLRRAPRRYGALAVVGGLGTVAWMAFTFAPSARRLSLAISVGIVLVAAGLFLPRVVELRLSPYKALSQVLRQQDAELAWTEWNAFSRVDVVRSAGLHQAPGLSFTYTQGLPPQTAITLDGDNLSSLTAIGPEEAEFTEYLPTALAYELAQDPRVLVVEPGGGLDVLTALHGGAGEVLTLVGNPLEAKLLRDEFGDETGGLFTDPRVDVVTGNPRSYLAREGEQFDVVVVSLRDAFRPITAGAYSLAENHLYTKDAFKAYLRHVGPGGLLMVTRWVQTPASEELRMAATVVEAFEELGTRDLEEKLVALRTLQTFTLLAKKEPFTPLELGKVRAFATSRQIDISYLPGIHPGELNRYFVLREEVYYDGLRRLLDPETRSQLYREQDFNVAPTTDQRPFFFHFFRWRQVPDVLGRLGKEWLPFGGAGFLVILGFLAVSLVVSAALILAPLLLGRGQADMKSGVGPGRRWGTLVYFFAVGLAFFWLEVPLMQRFILPTPRFWGGPVCRPGVLRLRESGLSHGRVRVWAGVGPPGRAVCPLAQAALGLPLAARVPIAILIAPLGLLMGVPFPSGIAALGSYSFPGPGGSTATAIMAALMALSWGFPSVMLAAAGVYLVAWAALALALRRVNPAPMAQSEPALD